MRGTGWACSGCRSVWHSWAGRWRSSRPPAAAPACSSASRSRTRLRRTTMADLRIFIADDHAVVREGLRALVNAQPGMRVVGEAGDGRDAYRSVMELRPDVAVMDISMPGWTGSQATGQLKKTCPEVRMIALT